MLGTHQIVTTVLLSLHWTDIIIVQRRKLIMFSLIVKQLHRLDMERPGNEGINCNTYNKGANRSRWMDELGFYIPSTVFQSFRDDGRVNMKGSVQ